MLNRLLSYADRHFAIEEKLDQITDKRSRPQIPTSEISKKVFTLMLSNLGSLNQLKAASEMSEICSPSVSTIARSADTMDLDPLREALKGIYLSSRRKKMLGGIGGRSIGILDGHEVTSSSIYKCQSCRMRNVSKIEGVVKLSYYHSFVAFILAGQKFATMLDIEPILPGQGELTAAYRLIERVCTNYPKAFSVVAGDALYLAADIFDLLLSHKKYAIAVLKNEKRQLYEEAVALSSIAEPYRYENGNTSYRVWEHNIEGLWDSYKKEVTVIRSLETTVIGDKESRAEWMWVTNLPYAADLENTVRICHSRWQVENQCFNELSNIWSLDHIYRHGANAIAVFILFLFIAVNITNIFFNRNIKDKRIRTKVFLIDLVKACLLLNKRSILAPNPIPI